MPEIFQDLVQRLEQTQVVILAALMLARTMPMIFLTPFLGGKLVPVEIKMGMGVLFVMLVFPMATGAIDGRISISIGSFPALMLKEIFVGFAIGFTNAHIFFAMDISGRLIDTVRGTSMSEVQDPHSKKRVTPTGDLYTQLFLIIFMVAGGHHVFLTAYFYSFESLPIDRMLGFGEPHMLAFFDHLMHLTAEIITIAVVLAAPVMAATFISDVVFGILNRVAPQLNAYFMSMPVKALGGVIMLFIAIDAILFRMQDFSLWLLKATERTMELLFP